MMIEKVRRLLRQRNDFKKEVQEITMIRERYTQCLRELGVDINGDLRQLRPLSRLVSDMIPDRNAIQSAQVATATERRRRKRAEAAADILRVAIERVLCDELTKNEAVRIFEKALQKSAAEIGLLD